MKHQRLKLSAIFLLGLGLSGLRAQEVIPATGGNASGSGGTVSYTVGQVVYTTNTGTTGSVAQGVQQAYEISVVNGIEQGYDITLQCTAYPNPTTDYLTLSINDNVTTSHDLSLMSYQLYDLQGKLLENKKLTSNETTITMENRVAAIYFLKVTDNQQEIKSFKIIKQ